MSGIKEKLKDYFSYDGRITRETFILRFLGRWAVLFLLAIVFICIAKILETMGYRLLELENPVSIIYWTTLVLVLSAANIILLIFKMLQEIKRLQDMNRSGFWVIVTFIPLIRIIYFIILALKEGTSGPNKYGDEPK